MHPKQFLLCAGTCLTGAALLSFKSFCYFIAILFDIPLTRAEALVACLWFDSAVHGENNQQSTNAFCYWQPGLQHRKYWWATSHVDKHCPSQHSGWKTWRMMSFHFSFHHQLLENGSSHLARPYQSYACTGRGSQEGTNEFNTFYTGKLP